MKRRSEAVKLRGNKYGATGVRERRVLPDGQGGFIIATTRSTSSAGPCRTRGGEKLPLSSSAPETYRENREGVNGAPDLSSKDKLKAKVQTKAFVPMNGRGNPGKRAKKTSSLNSGPSSIAVTCRGKSISIAGGRGGVRGREPRSLDELMNGGLAARR